MRGSAIQRIVGLLQAATRLVCLLVLIQEPRFCVGARTSRGMSTPVAGDVVERAVGNGWKIRSTAVLAELWAGYGLVYGLDISKASETKKIVVKKVAPPVGVGADDEGHMRKLRSYEVEAAFYSHCAPSLLACEAPVAIPRPFLVDTQAGLTLVMSDLREEFPIEGGGGLNEDQLNAAIVWLARFHAASWETPLHPELWPQGGYWRLETRRKELGRIGREWSRLRVAAEAIDRRVRGLNDAGEVDGTHRTVVHGDCKCENLALRSGSAGWQCAAYDFQYCGGGYPSCDLVQLLVSSGGRMSEAREEELLGRYLSLLARFLAAAGRQCTLSLEELRRQYELCLLDYVRFLAGWGFWGDVAYAKRRAKALLDQLDQGEERAAEFYAAAVRQHYPLRSSEA